MKDVKNRGHYDVIVLGVGSMGSAACWFLSRQGYRVLGLEQFDICHDKGAHAGQSRLIRKAYFEHPDYVPLLERAYQNWQLLEKECGEKIYYPTGLLYAGKPDNENILRVKKTAELYGITLDQPGPKGIEKTSTYQLPADFEVIYEPDAGFVTPERAVENFVQLAEKSGATILRNTPVLDWRSEGNQVVVATADASYTGDKLIITAGAWTSRFVSAYTIDLKVTRQVLAWIDTEGRSEFDLGNLSCWLIEDPERGTYYGFPTLSGDQFTGPSGFKLAHHFPGKVSDPDTVDRSISPDDEEDILYALKKYFPTAGTQVLEMKTCLYTNSDDTHFIIDHLPGYNKQVTLACGFSGHGFKFVSAIGEILADLAVKGTTDLPIEFLRLSRFR